MTMPTFEALLTPGLLLIVWVSVGVQNSNIKKRLESLLEAEHACQLNTSHRFGQIEKDLGEVKVQQLNHIKKHESHEQAIARVHQRIDDFKNGVA